MKISSELVNNIENYDNNEIKKLIEYLINYNINQDTHLVA